MAKISPSVKAVLADCPDAQIDKTEEYIKRGWFFSCLSENGDVILHKGDEERAVDLQGEVFNPVSA